MNTKKRNQVDIAKEFNVTQGYISRLKSRICYTTNVYLAIEVSKLSGLPATEHIKLPLKSVFIKAYPELVNGN